MIQWSVVPSENFFSRTCNDREVSGDLYVYIYNIITSALYTAGVITTRIHNIHIIVLRNRVSGIDKIRDARVIIRVESSDRVECEY